MSDKGETYKRCEIDFGPPRTLRPCNGMTALVGRSHAGRGGGIRIVHLVNWETCEPTRDAWVLHSGEYQKRGMSMNYCPMCGSNLMDLFSDPVKTADAAEALR